MNIADPKYLEHLRDLPSGYLLDLLADNEDLDKESICWVLQEHGLTRTEIESKIQRRRSTNWPRSYTLWTVTRWITVVNAIIVAYFNITGGYRLLQSDHAFKGPLLFFSGGCILCGFIIGSKLTTHLYQGSKSILNCGFPIAVGHVDLESGEEIIRDKPLMILGMALNALVGVNLVLFPLVFLYIMLE